ncbi:MAG: hypothetical protein HY520_04005 [Candidatus Aenigmarchaeota archaeon]|nr:hypothetical protein [Candidatus Aenigmarchaeota archaeon]
MAPSGTPARAAAFLASEHVRGRSNGAGAGIEAAAPLPEPLRRRGLKQGADNGPPGAARERLREEPSHARC